MSLFIFLFHNSDLTATAQIADKKVPGKKSYRRQNGPQKSGSNTPLLKETFSSSELREKKITKESYLEKFCESIWTIKICEQTDRPKWLFTVFRTIGFRQLTFQKFFTSLVSISWHRKLPLTATALSLVAQQWKMEFWKLQGRFPSRFRAFTGWLSTLSVCRIRITSLTQALVWRRTWISFTSNLLLGYSISSVGEMTQWLKVIFVPFNLIQWKAPRPQGGVFLTRGVWGGRSTPQMYPKCTPNVAFWPTFRWGNVPQMYPKRRKSRANVGQTKLISSPAAPVCAALTVGHLAPT